MTDVKYTVFLFSVKRINLRIFWRYSTEPDDTEVFIRGTKTVKENFMSQY
jgi:hypothetical protein